MMYRLPTFLTGFQSTRPARGATIDNYCKNPYKLISIHAPREGRDAPPVPKKVITPLFQSTRPARGATQSLESSPPQIEHFNPRAPRGARPSKRSASQAIRPISIHAPREGRDRP